MDPFDPTIVYGSIYPPNVFHRNEAGGEGPWEAWTPSSFAGGYTEGLDGSDNWLFYPPFTVDPNNEGVLYLVSNRVYRTDDRGDSWYPISDYFNLSEFGSIQSIAVSASHPEVLYAGTTDGTIWLTPDGGGEWVEVTGGDMPPRNVTRIVIHPEDPGTAFAVFGGFELQTPDSPGHVFVTTDGGASWDDISLNLPDAPLSAAVVDARPQYAGLYVGGALGVWVLQDGADGWLPYGSDMPFALVSELELNPETRLMAAATYGRGVWVMEMP